ncbi:hypothetical protein CSKR_110444, partial [Clonorchis sinensis]
MQLPGNITNERFSWIPVLDKIEMDFGVRSNGTSSDSHHSFEQSSSYPGSSLAVRIPWRCRRFNIGHLRCEASDLTLLHQHMFDASEFSSLNRRECSHLSAEI